MVALTAVFASLTLKFAAPMNVHGEDNLALSKFKPSHFDEGRVGQVGNHPPCSYRVHKLSSAAALTVR